MKDHRKKVSPVWKMISLGLIATFMVSASGCETDLFDDQIYPENETREECYSPELWRCDGDDGQEAQLCRNGFWNPWYNCSWNGGTCEISDDATMGGCVDPPEEQIVCGTDIWDPDTGTDPDAGPTPLESDCSMCDPAPTVPEDFGYAIPNASDGVVGCCAADGNAYWGEDAVVMQSCGTAGCCAFIDYTSTLDMPTPIRHGCCE